MISKSYLKIIIIELSYNKYGVLLKIENHSAQCAVIEMNFFKKPTYVGRYSS